MKRILGVLLSLCLVGVLLLGCGGTHATPATEGRLSLTVKWPQPTRLIPTSAQSMLIYLYAGGVETGQPFLLKRPTSGSFTTTTNFSAPVGALTVSVNAFASMDGTGVSQAFGQEPIQITATGQAQVTVSLSSTVSTLAINPPNPTVSVGTPLIVTVTGFSAVGDMVPLSSTAGAEPIAWKSGNSGVLAVSTPGTTSVLTGVVNGSTSLTATMTVKDDGTSVSGTTTVTVNSGSSGGGNGGLEAGSPWPMFQKDNQHSGVGLGAASTGTVQWTATGLSEFATYGTVDKNGTIYVGPVALSPSGQTLWVAPVPGGQPNSPAIGVDGTLYYTSQTSLAAVNPADGSVIWTVAMPTADYGVPPAIGNDGTLYVNGEDGTLRAYTPSGSLKWSMPGSSEEAAPAIGPDGTIFAGSSTLNAFTPAGTLKWAFNPGNGTYFGSATIGSTGTVYACDSGGLLHAVSASGVELWHYATGFVFTNGIGTPPVVGADGTVYMAIGQGSSGALIALTSGGSLKWTEPLALASLRQIVVLGSDGTIYLAGGFAQGNQTTYAFSSSGAIKWQTATTGTGGGCHVLCSDAAGTLYVSAEHQDLGSGTYTGAVFAVR